MQCVKADSEVAATESPEDKPVEMPGVGLGAVATARSRAAGSSVTPSDLDAGRRFVKSFDSAKAGDKSQAGRLGMQRQEQRFSEGSGGVARVESRWLRTEVRCRPTRRRVPLVRGSGQKRWPMGAGGAVVPPLPSVGGCLPFSSTSRSGPSRCWRCRDLRTSRGVSRCEQPIILTSVSEYPEPYVEGRSPTRAVSAKGAK